jgi:hypothetical protein
MCAGLHHPAAGFGLFIDIANAAAIGFMAR